MKIIFFGTPSFAAHNLQKIIESEHETLAVVTGVDSKKGRGKKNKPSSVKILADEFKIPVLQPVSLSHKKFIQKLIDFNADLFIVVAFRKIPVSVWRIPKKGTINLHTSFLPNYRGAAPINWVLINNEKSTGVTTFFIDEKIDNGEIILQKKIDIDRKITAGKLHNMLIEEGSKILLKTLSKLESGIINKKPQVLLENFRAAPKLTKEICKIDWSCSAEDIYNLIRGLSPMISESNYLKDISICPCAWFFINLNGSIRRLKIYQAEIINSNYTDRLSINTDNKNYFHISLGNQSLSLLFLQIEGKKPMKINHFLQGINIDKNTSVL